VALRTTAVFLLTAWVSFGAELHVTPPPAEAKSFLDKHCAACHRPSNPPGGIDLTSLPFTLEDRQTFSLWVRVHDAVRDGKMPPAGVDPIPQKERDAFAKSIAFPMITYEQRKAAVQGRSILRRLNRYEYENTVRDLLNAPWLQLRDSLPEDGIANRFNKVGEALDISHVQMARYMETAEQALRLVVDASKCEPYTKRYYARDQKRFISRMRYSPFNHHPERATIPIFGFEAQPDVLAEKVPISVGYKDPATRELEGFATPASTYVGNEYYFDGFKAPVGGHYHLRFNVYSIWIHSVFGTENMKDREPYWHPDRQKTSRGRTTEPLSIYALSKGGEKRLLGSFDVGPEPALHDIDVSLLPGEQIWPDAARLFRSRPGFVGSPDATADGMPGVAYRWMEVTGPVDSAAARETVQRLFGEAKPEPLLRSFMTQAYRRQPPEHDVERYLKIVQGRLGKTDFTEAMMAGYIAVLCSPGFLFLEEQPGRLDSYALASRLSYFAWNAPPDPDLSKLAADGSLRRPDIVRAQVDRLLNSPRSRDFINAFLDYWLDLRKIGDTTPDVTLYPDYYLDDLLVESSLKETQLFFNELVQKNLPASNIIQSDFTYLNSHLAHLYGLPSVEGVDMRHVKLPAGSVRGGVLTQASVLKVTANGTTTSPVLRGAWIMERILGEPPPPPPPGIPAVEPDTRGATTIRQQLDKHRSIQSCAVCHTKIDPPGFALENFDVVGAWRDRYRSTDNGEPVKGLGKNGFAFTFHLSQPVDASGRLANGAEFSGVNGLKTLLAKDERRIARNLLCQLITYATGTPVGFADRAEVERMLDASARDHYGVRTLIHQISDSPLFTKK
jgi:hypothetical protein